MNIFIPNLCLVLYIFTKVNGTEVTTQKDPLKTSNDTKSTNTEAENQKIDLNLDKTEASTKIPQSKFDIKDFKITKLKGNHNEEDIEECLATANPEKVEAVKKTLKNSEHSNLNDEEAKIAACLKKGNTKTTNTITTEKGDNKTATKMPLETVEEVDMKLEGKGNKTRRRDTEYQFDPLEYYDETVTFDPDECPKDVVEVITLQIAEVRQYDVECELLTHWIGLVESDSL